MNRSSGVALITVLLVVAAATIVSVAVGSRLQVDIRRTENLLRSNQAWQHALGVESWAKGVLTEDFRDNKIDHLTEAWTGSIEDIPVEGGVVSGRIIDQQGLFNLNNLLDVKLKHSVVDLARFQRLLRTLELDKNLANAVLDWLDKDDNPMPVGGAEDSVYQSREPPYSTANRLLVHPSELLLIEGFTPEIYTVIVPYVSALPKHMDVNINTAPAVVLQSLFEGLTEQDAEMLISTREADPFSDIGDFMQHPALAGLRNISRSGLGLTSDYFRVQSAAYIGRTRLVISSLLYRADNGDIQVILRLREDNFSG